MPSSATQTFRAPSATERVSELTTRLEEEFRAGLDRARREVSEQFNRAIRRLTRSEARNEWAAALLDAAVPFASRAALFMIAGSFLRGLGARGLADDAPRAVEVPLSGAPAFANAATSRETVAALRSVAEILRDSGHVVRACARGQMLADSDRGARARHRGPLC